MKRVPIILTASYLGSVILATIPIFTGDGPLSGVFAMLLSAPWSILLGKFIPEGANSVGTALLLIALGAAINAALIYGVAGWVAGRVRKG